MPDWSGMGHRGNTSFDSNGARDGQRMSSVEPNAGAAGEIRSPRPWVGSDAVCRLLGISLHTQQAAEAIQRSHFMSDLTGTKLRKLYEGAGIAFSIDASDDARKLDLADLRRDSALTQPIRLERFFLVFHKKRLSFSECQQMAETGGEDARENHRSRA
ncbi:MAG: hypothetical protein JWM36_1136 [Hyphomicrobiales bacterium]|nr:hypothetical protein [Hyphomicrobiales bacterium]